MSARTLRVSVAVVLASQAALGGAAARAAGGGWSSPTPLSRCGAAIAPRVAFPGESPSIPTGPGAIVWAQDPACAGGSAQATLGVSVAALRPDERTTLSGSELLPVSPSGTLAAVGASRGRVAVAVTLGGPASSRSITLLQGRSTRPLGAGTVISGSLFSLAHAYLGDAAIATVLPGVAIEVRVERYFRSEFGQPQRIPIEAGRVSALTATMDYRSDVLLAWQQHGAIYAHMLRASGRPEATQRIGVSAPDPQLRALVSDNDHGMIAWSSANGPAPGATSVRIAFSGAGVRFAGSRLVASFADPQGAGRAPGALALVRLSTENVMLAWTDSEHGHYVVRAAPAVFAGTRPPARLSDPAARSVLADLAPGPAGEAVALWSATPAASFERSRNELWAARAFVERHGRVGFSAPELVAPAAANAASSVAVDPASDRALAAWLVLGARTTVEYASGRGASGYRPQAATASTGTATQWLQITLACVAAAAIGAVIVVALRRRARGRSPAGANTGRRRRR
ncbi:MAG TPA: hypothetical protein VNY35_02965 [Solirubrobacteraceae bacterium]|nr:hypothetical protein [Solirubrobacteraceae bacterium]